MKLNRKQVEQYDTLYNKMYLRADEIVSYYQSLEKENFAFWIQFFINGDTVAIEYGNTQSHDDWKIILLNIEDFVGNWKETVYKIWEDRVKQRIKREEERKIVHQQILDNMNERLKQSP